MTVEEILKWTEYAEDSGYGYVLRSDHLLPTIQTGKPTDSPECWVTLGVIAAKTRTIKFGPLVSPIGWRNPALLARMACTLDSFTGGRLVLAIGAGWFREEYAAHGYEFPRYPIRKDQFTEAVKIIRPLTEGLRVDFQGKHYTAHTACFPKPNGKVHLIIGGKNLGILEIAATYADELNIYDSTSDVLRDFKRLLDMKAASRKIEVSRMGPFIIGESKKDLELKVAEYSRLTGAPGKESTLRQQGVLCGKPDEFAFQLNEFIEAGVGKFYFQVLNCEDRQMVDLLTDTLRNRI